MSALEAAAKPLDVGSGRVCASFDLRSAAWLSIGAAHLRHGFIELSALPAFDEAGRGDPASTRAYRQAMTRADHAFLRVELNGDLPDLVADPSDANAPRWTGPVVQVACSTEPDAGAIRQTWSFNAGPGPLPSILVRLLGRLDRPPLAEITELDPPEPTGAATSIVASGSELTLTAPHLPAQAIVKLSGPRVAWTVLDGGATAEVPWPPGASGLDLELEVSLSAPGGRTDPPPPLPLPRAHDDAVVDRALTYIRGCTALAIRPGERVMITDHRILPLSWTRDAYWQALALLAADAPGDRARVADQLRWLWRGCERPDGRWVRSHHADGRRKDLAFQADQQLYPMLELADYWRLTGKLPGDVEWDRSVSQAWAAALEAVDPETGLLATAENAADDVAVARYIGASQVLMWYAGRRLAELARAGALALDATELQATAEQARNAFMQHIARAAGPWAYASDGPGTEAIEYHDANDLPIALAPVWGFCSSDDPGWLATTAFAFGPANPAWVTGDRPGLGSAHTPGVWTLGDLQARIVAHVVGDEQAARRADERLREVAFADGMLPEAYSADREPIVRVRHWFAWPGAVHAVIRILEARGELTARLGA